MAVPTKVFHDACDGRPPEGLVAVDFQDWFDVPIGTPVQVMNTREFRSGTFRGVSRLGNIMVDVPGLKRRVSSGYRGVFLTTHTTQEKA